MKVLVIGHSSYDISCPVEEYPVENTKYRLDENVMCGGGPAGNAAYLLGKWGVETYYAGVVGSDDFGSKIKKEFETVGVNTEYLETNYEKPTSISFIMINKKNGSRTLFNIAGERPSLKRYDFSMDPDVILIDGHEYSASMAALNKFPNAISIIDAGRITPELKELCKYCKYIAFRSATERRYYCIFVLVFIPLGNILFVLKVLPKRLLKLKSIMQILIH